MIGIVSYGIGNVQAFARIYARAGHDAVVTSDPAVLRQASHLILPGVGAFDSAMARLEAAGLMNVLHELALEQERPILGVCVGMQMMMEGSDEGDRPGLGWIKGRVRRVTLRQGSERLELPHMGWNDVETQPDLLFSGLPSGALFYFLHSYYVSPADPAVAIAYATHGARFVCAIRQRRLAGVQFHPEKSHEAGIRLLLNFVES